MAYASNRSAQLAEGTGSHDLALLLLRVGLGLLILAHGVAKIGSGPGFVLDLVAKAGLPAAFGYLVYVGEVVAPILLIVGLWTRVAALVVAINMVVAILLVHTTQLFTLAKTGGYALELQFIYLFVAIAVALLGAGRYSVGGIRGRWN